MRWSLWVVFIIFSGCGAAKREVGMSDRWAKVSPALAFECVHENIARPAGEADLLFLYARWLQKNNQLNRDAGVNLEIERLYRIAAEHNHPKANVNLQNGSMLGHFKLRGEEHLRLSEELIRDGSATGYLFVAYFLQQGSAGLKRDESMALRYFRKAADEGNPEAQYYVGDKLYGNQTSSHVSIKMLQCAADQGHGRAALELGTYNKIKQQYQSALEMFQLGVMAGDATSAFVLVQGFSGPAPTNKLDYLDLGKDLERAERYEKIWKVLSGYSYANPKVPEINEIVPLPPAKLPPWNGKLQWLEDRLANVPPEKPRESLIRRLAADKLLDPITGRPLPASSSYIKAGGEFYVFFKSGDICPRDGYWELIGRDHRGRYRRVRPEICLFKEGERLPTRVIPLRYSRIWPLPDRVTREEEIVKWRFYGDA